MEDKPDRSWKSERLYHWRCHHCYRKSVKAINPEIAKSCWRTGSRCCAWFHVIYNRANQENHEDMEDMTKKGGEVGEVFQNMDVGEI